MQSLGINMDYLDLKMALADASSNEEWQRCCHLITLLAVWARKLATYQLLAAMDG